jgi:hypothetical protein
LERLMKLYRFALAVAAIVSVVGFTSVAQATPINFDLTLTSFGGSAGNGTGHLQINGPINPFAQIFTTGAGLSGLDFTINGHTFDLSERIGAASVSFFLGSLSGINYSGLDGGNFLLSFNSTGLFYTYTNLDRTIVSGVGFITASLATTSTPVTVPEPATTALLGAGLIGTTVLRRRKKKAGSRAPTLGSMTMTPTDES